ncbi:MAG: serine/threonine-protein kinase [Thermoanaerobaculia bacterium]|jgi:hypothetical protein
MSSMPESLSPGSQLLHYVLAERFPGSFNAWKATDSRSGKPVAIKILTRMVPKDKGQRDAMLKEVRIAAALRHPGVAQVLELDIDREMLFMVTELVEGDTLRQRTRVSPPTRGEFLRLAFQVTEAVAHLHSRGTVHGELNSESFIVTPQGDVRLVGIGFSSIRRKHDSGPQFVNSIRPNDTTTASFLSPEQVTGRPVDARSDVFALGTVFYDMLEAKLPFRGASNADITSAIVNSAPAAPTAPSVDRTLLGLIGRCLQKIPDKRYQKADEILADFRRIEPNIDRIAARRAAPAAAPVAPPPQAAAAPAWIVVCELPYHELLRKKDPERASRLETRMQQFLGEAVYLFDGKVLDSLGPRMVADMPDAASALRAAQKGLTDIVEYNMSNAEEPVEPRTVVHYGELVSVTGKPGGAGLEIADAVLDAMEPMQTLVSEPVIHALGLASIPSPAGAFRGVNFYVAPSLKSAAPPIEPVAAPVAPPVAPAPAPSRPVSVAPARVEDEPDEAAADDVADERPAEAPPPAAKKSSSMPLVAGIAAVVILGGAAAAYFMMRSKEEPPPPAPATVANATVAPKPAPAEPPPTSDTAPKVNLTEVFLADIVVEPPAPPAGSEPATNAPPPDPKLVATANDIRGIASSIIRLEPSLTFVDAAAPTSRLLGGIVRKGDGGIVLAPTLVEGGKLTEGDPIALKAKSKDNFEPALALARWMASKLGKDLTPLVSANPAATRAYIDAVAQQRAGDDAKATAAARKAVAADARYLRAQELLHSLQVKAGNQEEAYKVAVAIAAIDPTNLEIRKELARQEADRGNAVKSIGYLSALLSAKDNDPDVLTLVGGYALAVGDENKFQTVVARLASTRAVNPRLHEPDFPLARGRVDSSVKAYYKVQETQQDNPWLSLKIGKLAVIRRSDSIVELERDRQQRLGNPYTLAMMNAFVAAGKNDAATADAEIARAESAAIRADDHYTLVAEVNVLLNRQRQVIAALDRAVARSEPSLTYITTSPLFSYLETDPRFTKLKRLIREKSAQLSAALQGITL